MTRPVVLVVEDEILIRMSTAECLMEKGFDVIQAGDADEAMRVLRSLPVDIVFSDINMPGAIDGVGLARWLQQQRPDVKVVLTSGQAAQGKAADFGPILDKPYRCLELVARLRSAIEDEPGDTAEGGALREAS